MAVACVDRVDTAIVVCVSDGARHDADMGPCLRRGDGGFGGGYVSSFGPPLVLKRAATAR